MELFCYLLKMQCQSLLNLKPNIMSDEDMLHLMILAKRKIKWQRIATICYVVCTIVMVVATVLLAINMIQYYK